MSTPEEIKANDDAMRHVIEMRLIDNAEATEKHAADVVEVTERHTAEVAALDATITTLVEACKKLQDELAKLGKPDAPPKARATSKVKGE